MWISGTAKNFPLDRLAGHLAVLRDLRPFLAGVLAPRLIFLAGSAIRIERLYA